MQAAPLDQPMDAGLPAAVVQRPDGVYFQAGATPMACQAAINQIFMGSAYFTGVDYGVMLRVLYQSGPELPEFMRDQPLWRFAAGMQPFHAQRRDLYKSVKIVDGEAEYYFEPVYFEVPDLPPQPARLNFDEFVADMWVKGIRFGIDAPAVKDAIDHGKVARIVVARRLDAAPGRDATVLEISRDIHRSNAPRENADGRFDLHTFQNRFPQVRPHVKLLRKVPRVPGVRGFELSGIVLEPSMPNDLDLSTMAGEGTTVERLRDGEYLVSSVEGFLNVDPATKQLSIGPKIISREGVSARTTGNLQLTGEYEEFGEVQEQRSVEGGNITIHGDVFGNINSRGGDIVLNRNLIGGSTINADGAIRVKGVASGAVLQTKRGEVVLARAESCIISGTRVVIGEASNCEIMADEVVITVAEGCAVAARKIEIGSAGPRKQSEMLVFALVPNTSKYDRKIAELAGQAGHHEREAQQRQLEIDSITGQAEVRNYLTLATRVRKNEVQLTAEQEPLFHKMAAAVGPSLRAVAKISLALKAAKAQQLQFEQQADVVLRQKMVVVRSTRCQVQQVMGDMLVLPMIYNPDTGPAHDRPAKEIKARIRAATSAVNAIFVGDSGEIDWGLPD